MGGLFNGCCGGVKTDLPWAIGGVHPTQLYEVKFHQIMAAVLWFLTRRNLLARNRLKFCLIAYCMFRFGIEFVCTEAVWLPGLSIYQWTCAAFIVPLAVQGWFDRRAADPAAGGSARALAESP